MLDGPQIRYLIKDEYFIEKTLELEKFFVIIHIPSLGNTSKEFCVAILLTFRKTLMWSAKNKMNDSTKIWRSKRNGIRVDGM